MRALANSLEIAVALAASGFSLVVTPLGKCKGPNPYSSGLLNHNYKKAGYGIWARCLFFGCEWICLLAPPELSFSFSSNSHAKSTRCFQSEYSGVGALSSLAMGNGDPLSSNSLLALT